MKLKMTVSLIIAFILIGFVFSTTYSKNDMSTESDPINQTPISNASLDPNSNKAEFSKHVEDFSKKLFKNNQDQKTSMVLTQEKKKELEGNINKEYGIREDILRYIEKTIPTNNKLAHDAAIKIAATSNFIYYQATADQAIKANAREMIALECLSKAMPNRAWLEVSRGISKLMRDTLERDKHMWDIDQKYFGWKVLENGGLSSNEVNKLCETGNY